MFSLSRWAQFRSAAETGRELDLLGREKRAIFLPVRLSPTGMLRSLITTAFLWHIFISSAPSGFCLYFSKSPAAN